MSFGCGVGDFLAVTKLAWKVYTAYKDYKDAPIGFSNISDEIKSLHIIVDRHKDEFQNSMLNPDETAQLREILQGCTNVLEGLDRLRIKYMSLGSAPGSAPGSSSQAVDRIKWSQENIAELRARLNSNTTLLTSFIASGTHAEINRTHAAVVSGHAEVVSGQAGLLSEMEKMKNLINGLRRKTSTLSLRSIASFAPSINTKEAMKQLCKNLYKAGVRADMIRDREIQALAAFQDPNTPTVVDHEGPQTAGSVVHEGGILEGRQKSKSGGPTLKTNTRSFRGSALDMATALGLKQGVQLLLANGANIEATISETGATPLDTAAYYGCTDMVRLLLEKGANIEATRSNTGETPLDTASWRGHVGVVGLLLEKGANIEARRSDTGATPLDIAAYCGHTDVVRLLLEKGANIEATRSDDGATPLYCASFSGHVGVVSLLLDNGANTEATRTDNGRAALHAAALYLQTEVVQLLLEKGANIHAVAKQAETALHFVFIVPIIHPDVKDSKQLIPTIAVLLAHGANILQKEGNGKTPLDLAEEDGHSEAKSLFLRHIKEHNLKPPQQEAYEERGTKKG